MPKHLDTLMQKEMTRKEFVATLGFGLLSIMGLSTIIRVLTGTDPSSNFERQLGGKSHFGYGGGSYGGGKDSL